jgi:alpha-tubulin suppressor-like RCC1 family protein
VLDSTTNIEQLVIDEHGCVLHDDGTVSCWATGEESAKSMGDVSSFGAVSQLVDVAAIALGFSRPLSGENPLCTIRRDGHTMCGLLGAATPGRAEVNLGLGSSLFPTPQRVYGLQPNGEIVWRGLQHGPFVQTMPEPISELALSSNKQDYFVRDVYARSASGVVYRWTTSRTAKIDEESEYEVVEELKALGSVTRIAGQREYVCAILSPHEASGKGSTGSQVWCWGDYPQPYIDEVEGVADAHERDDLMDTTQPTLLPFDGVVEVALGREHMCVLLHDERLLCWGANQYGQLGVPPAPTEYSLPQTIPQLDDAVELVLGNQAACVKRSDESWWCWGDSSGARRTKWARWSQPARLDLKQRFAQLHLEQNEILLLDKKGSLYVWDGSKQHPCLADRDRDEACGSSARPYECCALENYLYTFLSRDRFEEIGKGKFAQLSRECMLTRTKHVLCTYNESPSVVDDVSRFEQIASFFAGGCGLTSDGLVECWRSCGSALAVQGVPQLDAVRLDVWRDLACGKTFEGRVWCWTMSMMDRDQPFEVTAVRELALEDIAELAGGQFGLCARTQSGSVWCWRGNEEPAQVPELDDAVKLAVGFGFACAIVKDGRVRCWGSNSHGQLGISVRDRPVELNWREAFE